MLSIFRPSLPVKTVTAHLNPITYEEGRSVQLFHSPGERWMVTHTIPATTIEVGEGRGKGSEPFRSMFNPPEHLHLYQREEFHVVSGHARFFINGQTIERKADENIFIPVGTYHCFENASSTGEDLVVDIRLDEQDFVMEERFFRNFFGYLEDCRAQKVGPSIFQLLLFLRTADGPLAVSVPRAAPAWVGKYLSWAAMTLFGVWVGEWLLGYRRSYKEYYAGPETGTGEQVRKKL